MEQKKSIFLMLAVAAMVLLFLVGCVGRTVASTGYAAKPSSPTDSESPKTNPDAAAKGKIKTLIVYYSYSGTTERVAEHLCDLTGGTLYKLELADPYTGSDNDVSDRVFAERDDGNMPELTGTLPDVSTYDRIFIGTPVWNDSMANPVR